MKLFEQTLADRFLYRRKSYRIRFFRFHQQNNREILKVSFQIHHYFQPRTKQREIEFDQI